MPRPQQAPKIVRVTPGEVEGVVREYVFRALVVVHDYLLVPLAFILATTLRHEHFNASVLTAAILLLLNTVLGLILFHYERIRTRFKVPDALLLVLFWTFAVVVYARPRWEPYLDDHVFVYVYWFVAGASAVLWKATGRPVLWAYVHDRIDPRLGNHPVVRHLTRAVSGAFLLAFFMSACAMIPSSVAYFRREVQGNNREQYIILNKELYTTGTRVGVVLVVLFYWVWLPGYTLFFLRNTDRYTQKYGAEIKEWTEEWREQQRREEPRPTEIKIPKVSRIKKTVEEKREPREEKPKPKEPKISKVSPKRKKQSMTEWQEQLRKEQPKKQSMTEWQEQLRREPPKPEETNSSEFEISNVLQARTWLQEWKQRRIESCQANAANAVAKEITNATIPMATDDKEMIGSWLPNPGSIVWATPTTRPMPQLHAAVVPLPKTTAKKCVLRSTP